MTQNNPRGILLITGATGGKGTACSLLAAERGYDLMLCDLSEQKLADLAAICAQHNVGASHMVLDITDPEQKAQLTQCLSKMPGLAGVIHTVGLSPNMADWQKIIDVDLVQTVDMLELTQPHLNSGAAAVCIASSSGHMCPPNEDIDSLFADARDRHFSERLKRLSNEKPMLQHSGMAYAYSKKALSQYVAKHAHRWGCENKRLVSISPGLIDTEMGQLEYEATDNFDKLKSHIALGRLGSAQDIAATALFLVSDEAAYITGCDILVDGGMIGSFNA